MNVRIGDICTSFSGFTPAAADLYPDGKYPYFKVAEMNREANLRVMTETDSYIRESRKFFPKGAIVFPKNGAAIATNKKRILGQDSIVDLNTGGVRANESFVDTDYLFYLFQNIDFEQFMRRGAVPTLDLKSIMALEIDLPSLSDQQRIVDELDLLSGIIEKKNAQLRTLDELASTIFYEMFGDLITNERGWDTVTLKDICGINPSKKEVSARLSEQANVSFLPMEDLPIHAGYISVKQTRILNKVAGSYTYFADNDVLLAKVTPCFENGKVGIAHNLDNGVGFGSSEFFVLRPSEKVCKETLYFLVQTNRFISDASKQLTGTSGLRRVPRMFLENLQIGLPPISEQLSFANKFKHIFDERAKIVSSISSAEKLLSSRLDKYFNM